MLYASGLVEATLHSVTCKFPASVEERKSVCLGVFKMCAADLPST